MPARSAPLSADTFVAIVTQCDSERLWNLEPICARWRGPLSIAVLAPISEGDAAREANETERRDRYPVNALRNLALDQRPRRTTHAWLLDVDFRPARYSRRVLTEAWRTAPTNAALVVPSFELEFAGGVPEDVDDTKTPADLAHLMACLDKAPRVKMGSMGRKGQRRLLFPRPGDAYCRPFHHHGSTRFVQWLVDSKMGGPLLRRLPCIHGDHFEPFLVVPVCARGGVPPAQQPPPRFDERFAGYGKNKIDWVAALRAANYSFHVARDVFAVHVQHAESAAYASWRTSHKQGELSKSKGAADHLFDASVHRRNDERSKTLRLNAPSCRALAADWRIAFVYEVPVYHGPIIKDTVEACRASARACVEQGRREDRLWTWLAQLRQTPAHEWNRFYASSAPLLLPRGFQPTPGKISDAVTRVIDLLYGETAAGSAADVLAERHLSVAARRFPRAYPLEPGLWRNLLDDDRAFA